MSSPRSTRTVPLTWTAPAPGAMPDANTSVLLWVGYPDGSTDWCGGWLDADGWRDGASGGLVDGQVAAWADVSGPGHAGRPDQQLAVDVAMLSDALAPLIEIVADRCSGLSAEDWHALEDARQAIAQAENPGCCASTEPRLATDEMLQARDGAGCARSRT